jgi:tricorn protease
MRYPHGVHAGPIVFLCDEGTSSDGEVFITHVQALGLGPVVGVDTWGGLVGYNNIIPVMDGGIVTQSNVGFFNPKRDWIVENRGARPDIRVENRPEDVLSGRDPQLEKAVETCLGLIKNGKTGIPEPPEYPSEK